MAQSDDFSNGSIDPVWTNSGPAGTTAALGATATDGFLSLTTSSGNHNVYGANNGARLMQAQADEDFSISAGFLTTPAERYEMQGLLIEQDPNNWIRFDIYSDGTNLYAFGAITTNGSSSSQFNINLGAAVGSFLRVSRTGDSWLFEYSDDNTNWTTAGSFTHAMTVSSVGVFAGSTSSAAGYTAEVDWFEIDSDPIVAEDGTITPIDQPPAAADDAVATAQDVATTINVAADLLANDDDGEGGTPTFVSAGPAGNGTVTNNGAGTLTYTPNSGFSGTDTFTYTITDGTTTDTATVTVTVTADPSTLASDDFSDGAIDPIWTFEGPSGTTAGLGATVDDGFLTLTTPAGDYGIFGQNNAARLMQASNNVDFTISAQFLSTPTERYQVQGFLVEQDATNWIRFDTYSNGSTLFAFAATTVNGASGTRINVALPVSSAPYLRVTRDGDTWTLDYSVDGSAWTTAGSFSHTLTVTQVGLMSSSSDAAPGFTAQVDWFEQSLDPIVDEDGVITPINLAPVAQDDALAVSQNEALSINVSADLLANDDDGEGGTPSLASFAQPSNGTLVDLGGGVLSYTPNTGFTGIDTFTYTVTDGASTDTATATITVFSPPSTLLSDDFSDGAIDPIWTFVGPSGATAGAASTATDGFITLATPAGDFNVYDQNNGARLMQAADDVDFTIATRFLSTPTEQYQMQGLLVEQDAANWIRFDTYSNGSTLYAYIGVTTANDTATRLNVALPVTDAPYLRVIRSGDDWTFEYSTDGSSWTVAGSITHAMTVSQAGVFAGSTSGSPGFTAMVDWFENAADPIIDEDGSITAVNYAPDAVDDALTTAQDAALSIDVAADLLANDSDINQDALTITGYTQPTNGVLVDNGNGTLTYTPNAGYSGPDSFTYTLSDGSLSDTATVQLSVIGPPSTIVSDDFNDGVVDPIWTFEGPSSASSGIVTTATDSFLVLTTPSGDYNVYNDNDGARALQSVTNGDLVLTARFLSTPTERFQLQGFLVEQDANNWLRFDTYSNGTNLYAFAAVTIDGVSSPAFNINTNLTEIPYLRIERALNTWTFSYSEDGSTWVTAGSFDHTITMTALGPIASNINAPSGFTAQVDWIESALAPLPDEDATIVPVAVAPTANDDAFVTDQEVAIVIDIATELLGNDSDLNEDTLIFASFTQPSNGTLVDNGNGTLTFTPNVGYAGRDSFTYTLSDGALTDTATVDLTVVGPPSVIVSDDFNDGFIAPIWTFEGPSVSSSAIVTTPTESFITLETPEGDFNIFGENNGARLLQDVTNGDLTVSARFLSTPSERFQLQGFLMEEDAQNWIRFDTYSDGSTLFAFAAVTINGQTSTAINLNTGLTEIPYLRVDRVIDTWTFEYSVDGTSWVTAGSFEHLLTLSKLGPQASSIGAPNGFTARVDWIESALAPLPDEDATIVPVNVAPDAADDQFVVAEDQSFVIDIANDLTANDTDLNEDALTFVGVTQPDNGTVVVNGNGTLTFTPDTGFEGFDAFTYTISDGALTDTATVDLIVGNPIQVWYGDTQTFGDPGETQRWVNVLGDVATDGLTSLTFSLNNGPEQNLSLGPDTRRLEEFGDFNVEIDFDDLDGSSTDDVIRITANYSDNSQYTRDVTIDYESGATWAPDYSIDWSTVTDLQDVVQVVDGRWELTPDGVRTTETGYDRILAVGDRTWDNYEANLSLTLNQMNPGTVRDGAGLGFGMLWNGHTNDPFPGWQPHVGYNPIVSPFFNQRDGSFILHDHPDWSSPHLDQTGFSFTEGATYNVTIRVEQTNVIDRAYSFKIWEEGTTEPVGWTLAGVDQVTEPLTGGFLLIAHHWDITFHDLDITEIEGDDILYGSDSDDILAGATTSDPNPGQGQTDVFVGGPGSDVFVFGDAGGHYYDDGVGAATGEADYGIVWDFVSGTDQIQLAGGVADYTLTEDQTSAENGTEIWRVGTGGDADELIGVIRGVYNLDLNSADFLYVGAGA